MNKDFVHYEEALELKELGFNEPCFGYYSKEFLKTAYDKLINEGKKIIHYSGGI
jgi:hypothetical protein